MDNNKAPVLLHGPGEAPLVRDTIDPDLLPMTVFQALLYNQSTDRQTISNAIAFWDWLPKYAFEGYQTEEGVPNAINSEFWYLGERFHFTQFPGTCRDPDSSEELWIRRFPGIKEQAVELALMKLASDAGGVCERQQGERRYGVVFSIRQVRRELEAMGHSYKHSQVIEAIDILTSSEFLLQCDNAKQITRSRIITEYQASTAKGTARHSPEAQWRVFFHSVVARAIESAQYRQFDLSRLYSRRSYGITLVKRLIFASNISSTSPMKVTFNELRETTSGLNYTRTSEGVAYLEREINRLKSEGTLSHYEKHLVKAKPPKGGRPAIIDAEFTLYPGESFVAEVKAANVRQMRAEQELQLSPRHRRERQLSLALGE